MSTDSERLIARTGWKIGKMEVVIFPNLLEKNPKALQEGKVIFVAGRVDDRNGEIKIVADDAQEIIVPRENRFST